MRPYDILGRLVVWLAVVSLLWFIALGANEMGKAGGLLGITWSGAFSLYLIWKWTPNPWR